jgi:hypothetical protein
MIRAVCPLSCGECIVSNEPTAAPYGTEGGSAPLAAGHKFWIVFEGNVDEVSKQDQDKITQTLAYALDMKAQDVSARIYAGSFVAEITLLAAVDRERYIRLVESLDSGDFKPSDKFDVTRVSESPIAAASTSAPASVAPAVDIGCSGHGTWSGSACICSDDWRGADCGTCHQQVSVLYGCDKVETCRCLPSSPCPTSVFLPQCAKPNSQGLHVHYARLDVVLVLTDEAIQDQMAVFATIQVKGATVVHVATAGSGYNVRVAEGCIPPSNGNFERRVVTSVFEVDGSGHRVQFEVARPTVANQQRKITYYVALVATSELSGSDCEAEISAQVMGMGDSTCLALAMHTNGSSAEVVSIVEAKPPQCKVIDSPTEEEKGFGAWWHWLLIILAALLLLGCCAAGAMLLSSKGGKSGGSALTNGLQPTSSKDPFGNKPGDYEFQSLQPGGVMSAADTSHKAVSDTYMDDQVTLQMPVTPLQNEATFEGGQAAGDGAGQARRVDLFGDGNKEDDALTAELGEQNFWRENGEQWNTSPWRDADKELPDLADEENGTSGAAAAGTRGSNASSTGPFRQQHKPVVPRLQHDTFFPPEGEDQAAVTGTLRDGGSDGDSSGEEEMQEVPRPIDEAEAWMAKATNVLGTNDAQEMPSQEMQASDFPVQHQFGAPPPPPVAGGVTTAMTGQPNSMPRVGSLPLSDKPALSQALASIAAGSSFGDSPFKAPAPNQADDLQKASVNDISLHLQQTAALQDINDEEPFSPVDDDPFSPVAPQDLGFRPQQPEWNQGIEEQLQSTPALDLTPPSNMTPSKKLSPRSAAKNKARDMLRQ